jgi:hypothetical protein
LQIIILNIALRAQISPQSSKYVSALFDVHLIDALSHLCEHDGIVDAHKNVVSTQQLGELY